MEFVSAKEKAKEWGISIRRVQVFCEQRRIEGVQRLGKIWVIPKDAERPVDLRYLKNRKKKCSMVDDLFALSLPGHKEPVPIQDGE